MSSSYRMELARWLADLDVKAFLCLDIGGSQLNVKGRTKSWQVKEYIIGDLEQPHADSPAPDVLVDLNDPIGSPRWYKANCDLIFCLEVFDYVYNPLAAFKNIEYLLTPGGTAWVTFPSFYPTHQPIEDDALRYMEGGIAKLAAASHLTIEEVIKRRPETDLLEQFYRAERMRAAKHYDHNFTGWIVRFSK